MDPNILKGTLVGLTAVESKELVEAVTRWNRDSEYQRLSALNAANLFSVKKLTEWMEKDQEKDPPPFYYFAIRILDGDRLVGSCGLDGNFFPHGEAFVGIGIGERELWGKGYGTDAMMVVLRYGFQELNLRRISLTCSGFNPRAIRSYEKAGFVHEGRVRKLLHREGKRWDMVHMGVLQEEWLAKMTMSS